MTLRRRHQQLRLLNEHTAATGRPTPIIITRHRASTSIRWHFAFGLCCHCNETRTPIANPPNSAKLGGTTLTFPKLHVGPWSSVGVRRGTNTQTTDTQTCVTTIHFASSTSHEKCNYQPGIERVQALADILRWRYVVMATKPVHRLQIRSIVHPYHSPKLHLGACSNMGMRRGTDRHRDGRDQ